MPRICDSNSEPIDFCRQCFPCLGEAKAEYRFPVEATANDGRGDCFEYECDHPPYDDDDYTCEGCGKTLTWRDE